MDRLKHTVRSLSDCHNIADFRTLAKRRLPFPVFHYIDGGGDDEITKDRNTASFNDVDLVPDVLAGVATVDPSITVLGQKTRLPLMLSPTALQRLFHWQGERAVAAAAEKFGLWFGISSLASVGIEEIGARFAGPKMLQYYYHKDRGLNAALLEAARVAKFDAVALTVDTIVGGNRERCLRTGFTSPPRITPSALAFRLASRSSRAIARCVLVAAAKAPVSAAVASAAATPWACASVTSTARRPSASRLVDQPAPVVRAAVRYSAATVHRPSSSSRLAVAWRRIASATSTSRAVSPSSAAALVRSTRGSPMAKVKGSKASSRRRMSRSPARIALFNTCLKGSPLRRTSPRSMASTSGSSVTVVRMPSS